MRRTAVSATSEPRATPSGKAPDVFITRLFSWIAIACAVAVMALVAVALFLFFSILLLALPLVVLLA